MEAKINEHELRLLIWLHENVRGFNEGSGVRGADVCKGLGHDSPSLYRIATYLAGHQLVGLRLGDVTTLGSRGQDFRIIYIWLTSFGEDYIRNIEAEPGIARRLTVSTLAAVKELALKTASALLTEIIKQQMRSPE